MKILLYETISLSANRPDKCITPCPYGQKHPSGNPIKVGSGGCRICPHFGDLIDYPKQVKCNHSDTEKEVGHE
jgi:hypothetical protein